MALLSKALRGTVPIAGAFLVEPLLNFFAPSVQPLFKQFIQSDEAKHFLQGLVESAATASSGVCTSFLGGQADKLLENLKATPKLDGALIAALRKAFMEMRDDLRRRNRPNIINSFDQFFTDWD